MMLDLGLVQGSSQRTAATWSPVIVVRHGFLSSHRPFVDLADYLRLQFPAAVIDNNTYDWRRSVLRSGVELAEHILSTYGRDRDIVLVGHSMGGLVCRIANCVMTDPNFLRVATTLGQRLGYSENDLAAVRAAVRFAKRVNVASLVTLATPNSGAMLNSQVAGLAWNFRRGINFAMECIKDITGTRLFRLLQTSHVTTPCLSVSGSSGNRFGQQGGALGTVLQAFGGTLHCPHDGIVEDRSVDLHESILPNELVHSGSSQYVHLRCYGDCIFVGHTDIYNNQLVRSCVAAFVSTH